jgi:gas vesicle protein
MNKVMIALLTGFVAGILLAPEKGTVTRKKICDNFNGLSDKLTDYIDKLSPAGTGMQEPSVIAPKMNDLA